MPDSLAIQAIPDGEGDLWSLVRDNQLRSQLETSLEYLHGHGVLIGGKVTKSAAFAVQVEASTVLYCQGVALVLSAAATYSSLVAGTCHLWGVITVTRATQSNPAASDTYALTLTHNLTGTAPSSRHFLLATITVATAGIESNDSIDNNPAGKQILYTRRVTVAAEPVTIPEQDRWHLVIADFSDVGTFAAASTFWAHPGIDQADVVAVEAISHKSAGIAAWRVRVPSGVTGALTFTPVIYGQGFSGLDTTDIAATWTVEAEDEAVSALVESLDDLEQRFRALLLWTVSLLGETPPERLVPDFYLATAEAS